MRVIFPLFLILLNFTFLSAQQKFEVGVFGGSSYYMGDMNHDVFFKNPGMSLGGKINYSLTRRYQLDFNINYGEISGSGNKFLYEESYEVVNSSFSSSILDLSLLLEFDFLPFDNTTTRENNYTFYVMGGLGYTFPLSGTFSVNPHFHLPFGIGFKVCPLKRVSAGIEWKYEKTWKDRIDGIEDRENAKYNAILQNNDWYSFAGLFIVYRLFTGKGIVRLIGNNLFIFLIVLNFLPLFLS